MGSIAVALPILTNLSLTNYLAQHILTHCHRQGLVTMEIDKNVEMLTVDQQELHPSLSDNEDPLLSRSRGIFQLIIFSIIGITSFYTSF